MDPPPFLVCFAAGVVGKKGMTLFVHQGHTLGAAQGLVSLLELSHME